MIKTNKILFIPSCRQGNGMGHIKRCIEWSRSLDEQHFYLNPRDSFSKDQLRGLFTTLASPHIYSDDPGHDWDLVILDNRESSVDDIPESLKGIPLVAMDESGEMAQYATYLVELLPSLRKDRMESFEVNENQISLLIKETGLAKKIVKDSTPSVLVSFGGEDPADLSRTLINYLEEEALWGNFSWTFVEGPCFAHNLSPTKGDVLIAPSSLSESLKASDIVITSYGLTAIEALALGCSVILFNPSPYHDLLSEQAGFLLAKSPEELLSLLHSELLEPNGLVMREFYDLKALSFGDWIADFNPSGGTCPSCDSSEAKLISRNGDKSFFSCKECHMTYMINMKVKEDIYSESYFFEDYKKQYGKTYLDDFEHIKGLGYSRLKELRSLQNSGKTVLDVGCAYGPFLKAAQEKGYTPFGLDISPGAVNYINENLEGMQAASSGFEDFEPLNHHFPEKFDLITMWFVIEHFKKIKPLLDKVDTLLAPGGVFAFSTPHGQGLSRRFSPQIFWNQSPSDHYTIWDKRSVKTLLKERGYKKIRFKVTGHHPERLKVKLPFRSLLNRSILLLMSHLFSWGDTFEIYAQKG